jgi:hypothetical protein
MNIDIKSFPANNSRLLLGWREKGSLAKDVIQGRNSRMEFGEIGSQSKQKTP